MVRQTVGPGGGGSSDDGDMAGGGGPEGGASDRYGEIDTPAGPEDIETDDGSGGGGTDTDPFNPGSDSGIGDSADSGDTSDPGRSPLPSAAVDEDTIEQELSDLKDQTFRSEAEIRGALADAYSEGTSGVRITPGDIEKTDSGYRLNEATRGQLQAGQTVRQLNEFQEQRAEQIADAREAAAEQVQERVDDMGPGALPGLGQIDDPERVAERTRQFSDVSAEDIEARFEDGRVVTRPDADLTTALASAQFEQQFKEQGLDLQAGTDFTVDDGSGEVSAELTDRGRSSVESQQRRKATRQIEQQLEAREEGVDLEPGRDFTVERTEDGGYSASLTDAGQEELREARRKGTFGGDIQEFFTDVGEGFKEKVVEPTATTVGSVAGEAAESIPLQTTPIIGLSRAGIDQPGTTATAEQLAGKEDDVVVDLDGPETAAGQAAERVGAQSVRGVGTLATGAVELPATTVGALKTSYDAGKFTRAQIDERGVVAGTVESGEAAAGATGEFVESQAEFVAENPVLVGSSLLASGAVFRGARAIGPRTSGAARAVVQPGEEILGIGGNRLTRAVAGERAASRLFPNNEPLIFSEEAVLRGGSALRRRVGSGGRALGSRTSATVSEVGQRSPDVELRRGVDSPVEVSPLLKEQLAQAVRSGQERVGRTIGEGIADVARADVGDVFGSGVSRAQQAGRAVGETVAETVSDRPSIGSFGRSVGEGFADFGDTARRAGLEVPKRVRGAAVGAELSLEATARSGLRAAQRRGRMVGRRLAEDVPAASIKVGEVASDVGQSARRLPETVKKTGLSAELSAEANIRSGIRSVQDAGESVGLRVSDAALKASDLPSMTAGAIRGGEISVEAGLRSGFRQAQATGRRVGMVAAEAPRRVGEGIADVTTGEGIELSSGLGRSFGEGIADVARGDVGLRIGPVRPRRGRGEIDAPDDVELIVDADAFDVEAETETETETGEPVDVESGSNVISEVETQTGSGVAVQRVRGEVETETKTDATTTELEGGITGRRFETTLADESTLTDATQPVLAADSALSSEVGTDNLSDLVGAQEVETLADLESGTEVGGEVETEFEQEFETETEVELEQETETEFEQELETELETETETEVELEKFADSELDELSDLGSGSEVSKDFVTPVATPSEVLGGEVFKDG